MRLRWASPCSSSLQTALKVLAVYLHPDEQTIKRLMADEVLKSAY